MKAMLALVLLFMPLVTVLAAPIDKKSECRDQYGHCPEWSKAGYCERAGYKTYMSLMCAYSCDTCEALQKTNEPEEEEDVASASGMEDGELDNPTHVQETTGEKDNASANEPVSGEGETGIHGGDNDSNEEINQVHKVQDEQGKDASLESGNKINQSTKIQQRKSVSEHNKDAASEQVQDNKMHAVTPDRDPPGVQEVTFQDRGFDDEVNPRSKISVQQTKNNSPSVASKPLSEPKVQNKETTQRQDENGSGSGMLDGSGESVDEEKNTANSKSMDKSFDKTTKEKVNQEESEEMKDIAGDIKTGSKIFETDISEPESTSGCSSGFGCFSGSGEQIQSEKSEEAVELEPRSKIAVAPKVLHSGKNNQIAGDKSQSEENSVKEEINEQTKSTVKDDSSGSGNDIEDDIQSDDDEEQGTQRDDIARAKSVADSNAKIDSSAESETSEKAPKTAKSDENSKVNGQESIASHPSSGSGTDAEDDIQGQSIDGDNDESIDGAKATVKSESSSGSVTGVTAKSEPSKEVQNEAKNDVQNEKVNGQQGMDAATAKTEPEELNEEKENMKDASTESGLTNDNQSEAHSDAENEQKELEDTTAKSKLSNEKQSAANSDVENEKVNKQKENVKDKNANSKPDESKSVINSDEENEEVKGQQENVKHTSPKSESSNDNQSETKGDGESEEVDETNAQKENIKDASSGSGTESRNTNQSIGEVADEENNDENKSNTNSKAKPAEKEADEIEDALFNKEGMSKDNKASGSGSGEPERDANEDLSSPTARQRLTSMEQLIKDDETKVEKTKETPGKTRENVPQPEATPDDFIASDLGKGQKVKIILDQHYYKPYSNEDSMAYEMLALDLKKEVERAVGNQAIVSQITFSEIRKPGKLPRFSRVLATFMLHGDRKVLHDAVRKGVVGDLTVDKHFFRSTCVQC